MDVRPEYVESLRAWWFSFWFVVLVIVSLLGAAAYVAYLVVPAIAAEVA